MIPADEIASLAPEHMTDSSVVHVTGYDLDDEEQVKYDFIDAQLDEQAATFQGPMFTASLPLEMASQKVIAHLKTAWEAGGWIVGVFPVENGHQVVFAKPRGGISSPKVVSAALQARDDTDKPSSAVVSEAPRSALAPATTTPLLVRMPTRGRPDQALNVLSRYRTLATDHVAIEVVLDEDDETMNNPMVLQRLCDLDCIVTIGRHANKIHAVNGGRVNDWAILALASDDMFPVARGYDHKILEAMDRHFPLRDGAIYFNDGYNKDHVRPGQPILCTMPIMGRHLWEQFGYVYHPEYGSLYSDDEQTQVLTAMRRLAFVDEIIVEHRHHAAGKSPFDALYQHNDGRWGAHDKKLFDDRAQFRRPGAEWAFDSPPMWLSLLICSTPARTEMLERLVRYLRDQMRFYPRQVELVIDATPGGTIGEKRQRLLERAVGHYVAFIDDDDWVSHDYVARVLKAVAGGVVDCASLVGVMTTNGERPERFEHSLAYESWYTRSDGVHVRTPNHLNPVRRELALKVGFAAKDFGEDHDFSKALRPLLKTQAFTGDAPLYFYWFRSKERMGA